MDDKFADKLVRMVQALRDAFMRDVVASLDPIKAEIAALRDTMEKRAERAGVIRDEIAELRKLVETKLPLVLTPAIINTKAPDQKPKAQLTLSYRTDERKPILQARWPAGTPWLDIVREMNKLPGWTIPETQTGHAIVKGWAHHIGLSRPPADKTPKPPYQRPKQLRAPKVPVQTLFRTPEREEILRREWVIGTNWRNIAEAFGKAPGSPCNVTDKTREKINGWSKDLGIFRPKLLLPYRSAVKPVAPVVKPEALPVKPAPESVKHPSVDLTPPAEPVRSTPPMVSPEPARNVQVNLSTGDVEFLEHPGTPVDAAPKAIVYPKPPEVDIPKPPPISRSPWNEERIERLKALRPTEPDLNAIVQALNELPSPPFSKPVTAYDVLSRSTILGLKQAPPRPVSTQTEDVDFKTIAAWCEGIGIKFNGDMDAVNKARATRGLSRWVYCY